MEHQVEVKMKIAKPAHEVFEAFVDPAKISNFWFSSSSARWEAGQTITLKYDEYNAVLDIRVVECTVNKIVYLWGEGEEETAVTFLLKELDPANTQIEVTESGLKDTDDAFISKLTGQHQGWVYVLTCLKAYLEYGENLRGALVH